MPKKTPSIISFSPLFKKRLSDPPSSEVPKTPTRSTSWFFRGSPIEDFHIESLGSRSGHLVFGPLSVFNGLISLNVKHKLPGVAVSVTFRGLTEFNGKHLAFINETETIWQGDLEPGLRTFYFALRFPPLNLPPTCKEPELEYNFISQIKLRTDHEKAPSTPTTGEPKVYTSKPLGLTFIPYVDPFALSRYDTMRENNSLRRNDSGVFREDAFVEGGEPPGSKPLLKLTTANLPTSSPRLGLENKSHVPVPKVVPNPMVEKSAVIMDGHDKVMAKLRVKVERQRYIPGDEVSFLLALTLPQGGNVPKSFNASVVEKRWLGFERDEDADLVSDYNSDAGSKKSKSGRIFTRTLTSKKYLLQARDAVRLQKSSESTKESSESRDTSAKSEEFDIEGGIEIVERVAVRLPGFKAFVDESLLPSACLPLGTCFSETTPAVSGPDLNGGSYKGKEAIRPVSRRTISTTMSAQSNIIQGLHLDVSHLLHISVPLTGGGILKKPSGTLEVDLPIILGNKSPDIDYSHYQNKPMTPELRVTTPELVVSPPNDFHELKREGSKASFQRAPSPLKMSSSAYNLDGSAENEGKSSVGGGSSSSLRNGSARYGGNNASVVLNGGVEKKMVSFHPEEEIKWRRGERFPTLEEAAEGPVFIKS